VFFLCLQRFVGGHNCEIRMCFPPEISVPALPTAFVRVRDWRADERGSKRKQWRPSYVLPEEGVEIVSPSDAAPPAAPAHDVRSCGGRGAQTGGNHVDAAELCAAGIKLPLQQGSVAATNEEQHGLATWQGQQTFLDAAGAANMKKEGAVVSGVEESAGSPTRQHTQLEIPLPNLDSKPVVPEYADLEKLQDPAELFLEEGQQQGLSGPLQQQQQPLLVSGTPELESTGSFSAWFDCIAKNNDGEMEEATSLIKERSVTNASFETDTKPLKRKAPKLTKAEKNRKSAAAAAAVHSHEGTEVDMCTEDDDAEPLLIDEKRKRRYRFSDFSHL
jgi:hypothetical protein